MLPASDSPQAAHAALAADAVDTPPARLFPLRAATPKYTEASSMLCSAGGVSSPCFTVTWTKRDEIHQDFDAIFD